MRRKILFGVFTITLCGLTAGIVRVRAIQGLSVHQPFTAHMTETVIGGPATGGPVRILIVAVRQDGSRVEIKQVFGTRLVGNKIIVDVPSKTRISVDPATRSKTTYHMNEISLARYTNVPNRNVDNVTEQATILGYRTIKETRRLSESRVIEEWSAPDLGFFPLRSTLFFDSGQKIQEAISVLRGDPDPALFEVPSDYVERSPVEVFQELESATGRRMPILNSGAAATIEDAYHKSQSRKRN